MSCALACGDDQRVSSKVCGVDGDGELPQAIAQTAAEATKSFISKARAPWVDERALLTCAYLNRERARPLTAAREQRVNGRVARQPRGSLGRPVGMRANFVGLFLVCAPAVASAGVYGRLGGGTSTSSPGRAADCSKQIATKQPIPAWSRLQWSLGAGAAFRRDPDAWTTSGTTSAVLVPQASWQVWATERQCELGGGFFTEKAWRRVSLAISGDVAWRNADTDPIDARPALRLSRATYESSILSVGSRWVPTWELSLTAGPTFDPRWSGASVSFGARAAIFSLELRAAARTGSRGHELMLLFGVTDLHGLWKLGPDRDFI